MKKSVGVCLGASTVSAVKIEKNENNISIIDIASFAHNGDPKGAFIKTLRQIDPVGLPIVVTGRKFRNLVDLPTISEPRAVELACDYENSGKNEFTAIASLGGETFLVYELDNQGKISDVVSKNQCASGTGEFFLQQIKRMNLSLDEASNITKDVAPFKVSGRCSVFCKSDCTHALNKGVPKGEVASGLALMIADKIEELVGKNKHEKIMLVGGVTKNATVMEFLKAKRPGAEIPKSAAYFEALGAAIHAVDEQVQSFESFDNIFVDRKSSFTFHQPIAQFTDKVKFETGLQRDYIPGENVYLGLDVGSTTTKATLVAESDDFIVAKIYLYTNGNPIAASKDCYRQLLERVPEGIKILGVGVTGSGRHIAGLHALTDGVVNEITAHATAAVHFDSEVDTIFEIGGQDAKYTYIVNGAPADYAMNEACSAGTGSFIEEAAYESLGVKVTDIEPIALRGQNPPNFSDQCSAFISADIKTAQQESISKDDIISGLVYSVCLNYVNRVKGARPVGKKIFMQGGVCYNKSIPIAMAALMDKSIVVPPEPGLMGAYGAALDVKEKIKRGFIPLGDFSLKELSERDAVYGKPFICAGGKEKCDLKCSVNIIEIQGKKYPFGGACNKYYNMTKTEEFDLNEYDLVKYRNHIVFEKFAPKADLPKGAKTVGINNSFNTHVLYPLYYNFFTSLGFRVLLSDKPEEEGFDREISSFCFPSQLSLGLFQNLLNKNADYYFVPSIYETNAHEEDEQRLDFNCSCVFVSGEAFYLKQAFKDYKLEGAFLTPNLNFANGYEREITTFVKMAKSMGVKDEHRIKEAYKYAVKMQNDSHEALFQAGEEFIQKLRRHPDKFAMVIVGRPYNSFAEFANKNIPQKFASRGIYTVPFDMLDFRKETLADNMFWESGKKILQIAKLVERDEQLFATYVSNYSCAPDSMIMNSFRGIMGAKPSLTLELDSHSADAGINTRIEAALDIVKNYRSITDKKALAEDDGFMLADIEFCEPVANFLCSDGTKIPLNSPDVEILIPNMGDISAPTFASAFKSMGFNATALRQPDARVLKYGRANCSGKECLPLILMVGALIDYLEHEWDGKKKIAFFIVQGAGNCRLGQYPVFIRDLLTKRKVKNVTQMVLMNEDGFAGLGNKFALRGIQAIIASDVMDDVRSAVMANSKNPDSATQIFNEEFSKFTDAFAKDGEGIYSHIEKFAKALDARIPDRIHIDDSKYVAMLGEIYVRRDGFAHKWMNQAFAKRGFVLKTAHISEWIFYVDYLLQVDLLEPEKSIKKKFERYLRNFFMRDAEKKIKKALEKSGFYKYSRMEIEPLLAHSKHILPWEFKGEPGLTLGTALHEGLEKYCGIINMGPFGCMPTRFTESIALPEMKVKHKISAKKAVNPKFEMSELFNGEMNIPFLTIETDGNVFPQIIEAKIETFMLQAERSSVIMKNAKRKK